MTGKLINLEAEKAEMLEDLSAKSGIAQSVLMRAAIDMLLQKHGYSWKQKPESDLQGPYRVRKPRRV